MQTRFIHENILLARGRPVHTLTHTHYTQRERFRKSSMVLLRPKWYRFTAVCGRGGLAVDDMAWKFIDGTSRTRRWSQPTPNRYMVIYVITATARRDCGVYCRRSFDHHPMVMLEYTQRAINGKEYYTICSTDGNCRRKNCRTRG